MYDLIMMIWFFHICMICGENMFSRFKKLILSDDQLRDPTEIQRVINSLQNNISDSLNPMAAKVQNDSVILINQSLLAGKNNVINTTLGRKLIGYNVIRLRGNAVIWDTQDNNTSPNLTLWLSCSTNVVIDIEVF